MHDVPPETDAPCTSWPKAPHDGKGITVTGKLRKDRKPFVTVLLRQVQESAKATVRNLRGPCPEKIDFLQYFAICRAFLCEINPRLQGRQGQRGGDEPQARGV